MRARKKARNKESKVVEEGHVSNARAAKLARAVYKIPVVNYDD